MTANLPFSIFSYSSYANFLRDAYEARHQADASFSYEWIAQKSGIKSRTLARNILRGTHAPTASQLRRLAGCFALNVDELDYLLCLYQFQAAQGAPGAFDLFQKLMKLQKQHQPENSPFLDVEVATSVLHMTLLSLFDQADYPRHPQSIAVALKNRYTVLQIERAMQDLFRLNYVINEGGQYRVQQTFIKKYDFNANFFLRRYHEQCLELAQALIHNGSTDDRYLVGASFPIRAQSYPRLVKKLNEFIENLMHAEALFADKSQVVQLNFQMIRMTEANSTGEAECRRESKN